jgi:DNA-binding transcriptional ArsR family regulator
MQTLLRYLKTLADQTRLRLIGLLAAQKRSVEELATLLELKPSTVSWHLGKLKELDLVEMRAEGTTHVYRLNGRGLGRINRLLGSPERVALWAEDVEGDAWERKVLGDFLEYGHLKEIPAYRKKRPWLFSLSTPSFSFSLIVNKTSQRLPD